MKGYTVNGNGKNISPDSGIIPILKRIEPKVYSIVGTGFYISRYGLFMTAAHVLKELIDKDKSEVSPSYVCHYLGGDKINFRRILSAFIYLKEDIALGQADNYLEKSPNGPLMNLRGNLSFTVPSVGDEVVTYAYPENKILDFRSESNVRKIFSDYYTGKFLKEVIDSDHPYLPYRHYETSILIKSGASGGPVFHEGKIIGVNCRGWDFGTDDDSLSYIVPVESALDIELSGLQIPPISWEYAQIPDELKSSNLTLRHLIAF